MSSVLGLVRGSAAYLFFAVGLAWAAIGVLLGSVLAAWPVAACFVAGALLKLRPYHRLTWAWSIATAWMGVIVSAYQVYAWEPLLSGEFSTLAAAALAGFAVFAVVHVLLFYAGAKGSQALRPETS